jgi:hypothetical protein
MSESNRRFVLTVLSESLSIARLPADSALPLWATQGQFFSVTRTPDELSVVCSPDHIPAGVAAETGWRALKVKGPFALSEVGVLATLSAALAAAGMSLFAISTFDTDYLLVHEKQMHAAITALRSAGHRVVQDATVS